MNRLPNEILHDIFIQIPFKQRLECTYVCRYWYNSLSTSSLLYDIDFENENSFNQFISMLQLLPNRASQVEILNLPFLPTFDKRVLCNILPNLRIFRDADHPVTRTNTNYCNSPFELRHPNSKIEYIRDDGECEFTKHLFMFGSCNRLRYLDLKFKLIHNPRKDIFIHLKSAPYLTKIYFRFCKIGIEDMEILHEHVYALEVIQLHKIAVVSGQIPLNIIPATSVRYIRMFIQSVENDNDHPEWCKYLAIKYTNLKEFKHLDDVMFELDWRIKIKTYRDGIFPIYKTMGLPLPLFNVEDIPAELNPFHVVDEVGVRVSKVSINSNNTRPIFEKLAGSNVSKHVRVLTVDTTVISSPVMIQNFTSLTSISIEMMGYAKRNVNLNDYFNSFPATLKRFNAKFRDAKIDELPVQSNNVENLLIICDKIRPILCEAISTCFPKLDSLVLYGRVMEDLTINLANNHINYLDIGGDYEDSLPYGVVITNPDKHKPQFYSVNPANEDPIPATAEELEGQIKFTINYTSAEYFDFNNLSISSNL